MALRNQEGQSVDPVPFLVVVALSFLVIYSFGPLYLQALGLRVDYGVPVCTLVFLAVAAAAYHRLVWTHRPGVSGTVSGGVSFGQLWYAILILTALVVLLSLPLMFG
ncbi:hypothetical protein G9464_01835 [Halostella sp. JP-L12]|uniref:hypothetical protein n=1 Tax=Halostella TaxID=1843185 RepID=UPI000EF806A5|nr:MULTISPECIES: hypothetical protein [Halostella]NHN46341.1 hypothetical protein [Halostella sp. JP-L12]